jgi:hypothetical protein
MSNGENARVYMIEDIQSLPVVPKLCSTSEQTVQYTAVHPFLRTWDHYSGSQLDDENRMMSRAPRQRHVNA